MIKSCVTILIILLISSKVVIADIFGSVNVAKIESQLGTLTCGEVNGRVVSGKIKGDNFYPYTNNLKKYKNEIKNAKPKKLKTLKNKIAIINRSMKACKVAFPNGILIDSIPPLKVNYFCHAEGVTESCDSESGLCRDVSVDGLATATTRHVAQSESLRICEDKITFNVIVLDHNYHGSCVLVSCAVVN